MSDTPRTDEIIATAFAASGHWHDFARRLERELNGFVCELGCDDPISPPESNVVVAMVRLQEIKRELAAVRKHVFEAGYIIDLGGNPSPELRAALDAAKGTQ